MEVASRIIDIKRRRKTRLVSKLVHFVIHGRHISMECMIPKCKFSKQMIKKYLVTEYLFITEGDLYFKDFTNTLYAGVLFVYTRSSR